MAAEPQATVTRALDRLAGDLPALGVALSGGGDSLALLHMAAAWGQARGIRIEAATVDHALRPGSGDEAAAAGRMAAALGVRHRVLLWDRGGAAPRGNLMAAARTARLTLLAGWAGARDLPAVALGHTMDDQAETVLMRLARGAGVDGLSGMAPARDWRDLRWVRPLLGVGRADLRAWLTARGIGWIDDPTNEDEDFDRVRVRRTLAALDLSAAALAHSAAALGEARAALGQAALAAVDGYAADRGMLSLPAGGFAAAAPELRRRLIVAGLRWVTGADHGPRHAAVARVGAALLAGEQTTLGGVILRVRDDRVQFLREPAAAARAGRVAIPAEDPGNQAPPLVWDNRWRLTGVPPGAVVRATGAEALRGRDWREADLPRLALMSAPLVETAAGDVVPLLDLGGGIAAAPLRGAAEFAAILQAH